MKRVRYLTGILAALMVVVFSATSLHAATAKKFNLGVGGYFGIGGVTDYAWDDNGAFALGIQPEIQFFPIDNISVTFRCLWERYFYEYKWAFNNKRYAYPIDVIPFLFGVRFYTPPIFDKTKIFVGGGIGATAIIYHDERPGGGDSRDGFFAMDFYGGVEYEVINQLAIVGMFNTMLPNIANDTSLIARFMFFFGVQYYIPL
jgi:hypothetical protein